MPVTPALYGIIDSYLSVNIIRGKWDKITELILNKECELLYRFAFRAVLIARDYSGNKRKGFKLFKGLLTDFYDDAFLESEEDILKAVFDFYWQIKRNSLFWDVDDFQDATIDDLRCCKKALSLWESQDNERIEEAKDKLRAWLIIK